MHATELVLFAVFVQKHAQKSPTAPVRRCRRYINGARMYRNIIFTFTIFLICFFANQVKAERLMQDKDDNLLFMEALLVTNSAISAYYPEEFGVLSVLLSPLYGTYDEPPAITYTAVGGMASIGLYNAVELKNESYSKTDIFLRNMVLLNLWYGALYVLDENYHRRNVALNILPFQDGLAFNFKHEF